MDKDFFKKYYTQLNKLTNSLIDTDLISIANKIINNQKLGGKVIVVGNGGSAAIASHVTVDLNKAAGIEAINFNDPSMITCFGNDFGYENWVLEAIKIHCKSNDTVILISSSGESLNIINGMKKANLITETTVSFTGFSKNNTLSSLGTVNLWVDSSVYNYVEIVHNIWLLSMIDFLIIEKNKTTNS